MVKEKEIMIFSRKWIQLENVRINEISISEIPYFHAEPKFKIMHMCVCLCAYVYLQVRKLETGF